MAHSNGKEVNPLTGTRSKFNLVKHRGDPKEAKLQSGHIVYKSEYLYFTEPDDGAHPEQAMGVECAEYHGEHFLYVDPLYESHGKEGRGRWFAMCTCGSPVGIIDGNTADKLDIPHKSNRIAVCLFYSGELAEKGVYNARHQTSYINKGDKR